MKGIAIFFCLIFWFSISGQTPFPESGFIFEDSTMPRVDIIIPSFTLNQILAPENRESNFEHQATFVWTKNNQSDTLENIGFRLRGNTSRYSAKKSFKVDFTTFGEDRFHGLSEMNLNGEHNDPSIIRAKLCFDMYQRAGIPSSRTNMVNLYINGEYKGVYINVEHIDNRYLKSRYSNPDGNLYKCYYGSDFKYLGKNGDSYKITPYGNRVYELKSNEAIDDYSDLADFIDILNHPEMEDWQCELEARVDVDLLIRAMVMDVLVGNWDGLLYNKNNGYWYHNPETDLFEYIPFDLDNTFGIDWFDIDWTERNIYSWAHPEGRPLFHRILAVDEYRERYSYYMFTFIQDFFNSQWMTSYTKNHLNLISESRQMDTYAQADYGFDYDDFIDSYDFAIGRHVKSGLKQFQISRRNTVLTQLENFNERPIYRSHDISWDSENIYLEVKTEEKVTDQVSVLYQLSGGIEEETLAFDDGIGGDSKAGDGIFTATIPYTSPGVIQFNINLSNSEFETLFPRCGRMESNYGYLPTPALIINEFMASNDEIEDEHEETDDWLEIYNASDNPINLKGKFLSDDHGNPTKWPFPELILEPGAFLLIWADENQDQGPWHTNFKLNKDGEQLGIWDDETNNFAPIDTFTFSKQETDVSWGRYPDGIGPVVKLSSATPGSSNTLSGSLDPAYTSIKIYPNPTTGRVFMESLNQGDQISITDIQGRTHVHKKIIESQEMLDLSDFESGIYFIRISSKINLKTFKVIKI